MRAVAAPADKRFRRAHVKPARKRQVSLRRAWIVARVTAVLGVAIYGGWRGTALVLGAPALQVARVTVRGNERLSTGEVRAIVDGLKGQNILTVELAEWRRRLMASPWVEEATLRRMLPSRVDVAIRERRPLGIGRVAGTLYLVDAHGVVIDEVRPEVRRFRSADHRRPERAGALAERTRRCISSSSSAVPTPSRVPRKMAMRVLSSTLGKEGSSGGSRRREHRDVGLLGLALEAGLGQALGDQLVGALGALDIALQHADAVALFLQLEHLLLLRVERGAEFGLALHIHLVGAAQAGSHAPRFER